MSTVVVDLDSIRVATPGVTPAVRRLQPSRRARAGGSRKPTSHPSARLPSPEQTQAPPALRLTRRGRLVLLVAVMALALGLLTVVSAPAASTDQTRNTSAQTVVVQPGQTLWDIAVSVAPEQDPRDVIAEIVDINSLVDAGSIRPGQPLFVPSS